VSKAVRPNDEAEEEFRDYIRSYEQESVGLGDRLWTEIQAAISMISDYPAIGEAVRVRLDIFRSCLCTANIPIISKSSHSHIRAAIRDTGVGV
jgi:plasmid stabilization system protein ParE